MGVSNATVFITGANRGLGLAFAREARRRGATKVYAGMRNTSGFDEPGVVPVRIDVMDPASISAAAELAADTTLLVNNAGITKARPERTPPFDGTGPETGPSGRI
jgi:NAD(P)-dependent dehydrogenase (short-subunit alcohol dehydrogenase family)